MRFMEEKVFKVCPGADPQVRCVSGNEVMKRSLYGCGAVAAVASAEDDAVLIGRPAAPYVVVHDTLDGTSNLEAEAPVGTIFGLYQNEADLGPEKSCLQSGSALKAAGYVVFAASTHVVISLGNGTFEFTLDPERGSFVLTHQRMRMPKSGASYSVNDGRYQDWPAALQQWVDVVRNGEGWSGKQYRASYVGSLVSDVHYAMRFGGIAIDPRSHLRLVYQANPIAFLVEQAGGRAVDGMGRILAREPYTLHERLPLFAGSSQDVEELLSYGDVREVGDFIDDAIY